MGNCGPCMTIYPSTSGAWHVPGRLPRRARSGACIQPGSHRVQEGVHKAHLVDDLAAQELRRQNGIRDDDTLRHRSTLPLVPPNGGIDFEAQVGSGGKWSTALHVGSSWQNVASMKILEHCLYCSLHNIFHNVKATREQFASARLSLVGM